jgi:UPF0755 protein
MNRWTKIALCLLAAFFIMGCGLEQVYVDVYLESKSEELKTPAGTDEAPVVFTIKQGQSVAEIAGNLKAKGLISDTELFRRYLQAKKIDAAIQAGTYTLQQTMTIPEIARVLQSGDVADQQITIPEGKRLEQIAEIAGAETTIAPDEFLQLAQTGWRTTTLAETYDFLAGVPVTATLEGYLFPDTYRLPIDATAYDLVERMVANFGRQVTPEIREGFAAHGLTLHEGITLASIVEREAVVAAERPQIAGVYYNRLRDGWPLSACPTVQYALGYRPDEATWWKAELSFADLDLNSPYNTYRRVGLPPAPIANPGLGAIQATAEPAETEYYFFMVECNNSDGSHVFSKTEAEHLENFERCGGGVPQ